MHENIYDSGSFSASPYSSYPSNEIISEIQIDPEEQLNEPHKIQPQTNNPAIVTSASFPVRVLLQLYKLFSLIWVLAMLNISIAVKATIGFFKRLVFSNIPNKQPYKTLDEDIGDVSDIACIAQRIETDEENKFQNIVFQNKLSPRGGNKKLNKTISIERSLIQSSHEESLDPNSTVQGDSVLLIPNQDEIRTGYFSQQQCYEDSSSFEGDQCQQSLEQPRELSFLRQNQSPLQGGFDQQDTPPSLTSVDLGFLQGLRGEGLPTVGVQSSLSRSGDLGFIQGIGGEGQPTVGGQSSLQRGGDLGLLKRGADDSSIEGQSFLQRNGDLSFFQGGSTLLSGGNGDEVLHRGLNVDEMQQDQMDLQSSGDISSSIVGHPSTIGATLSHSSQLPLHQSGNFSSGLQEINSSEQLSLSGDLSFLRSESSSSSLERAGQISVVINDDYCPTDLNNPLAELQKVSQLVQNGDLSTLCDTQSSRQGSEYLVDDVNVFLAKEGGEVGQSPFLERRSEPPSIGDLSRIWGDIDAQGLQPIQGQRTLTGTVFPQSPLYQPITRSATFQPTHAKLDFSQLQLSVSVDRGINNENYGDLTYSEMASVISNGTPTSIASSENIDLDYSGSLYALQLSVTRGPCTGLECVFNTLEKTSFSIGRFEDNDFILGDPEISGSHVRFQVDEDKWQVVDLGSLNGTKLNGKQISKSDRKLSKPWTLKKGDKLVLGTGTTIKVDEYVQRVDENGGSRELNRAHFSVNGHMIDWEDYVRKHGGLTDFKKQHDVEEAREVDILDCEQLFVHGAYATQQGQDHRDKGTLKEDFIQCEFPLRNSTSMGLAMLFDGHGGTQAAQQCRHSMPELMARNIKKRKREIMAPCGMGDIFFETFNEVDDELGEEGSGCTATVLAFEVQENTINLQMANVGDSSGIMLNLTRHLFREMTHDHKVVDEDEQRRLDAIDVMRTHNGTRILGLNLARTLGDKFVKEAATGVIAEPHVSEMVSVGVEESVLVIMASDGLWDVLTFEEVAEIAGDRCIDGYELVSIVEHLVDKAVARGSRDDISVIALLLGQLPAVVDTQNSDTHNTDNENEALLSQLRN